jgi:hypothetical protein
VAPADACVGVVVAVGLGDGPLGAGAEDPAPDGAAVGLPPPHAASPAATEAAAIARSIARREMLDPLVTPERYRFSGSSLPPGGQMAPLNVSQRAGSPVW